MSASCTELSGHHEGFVCIFCIGFLSARHSGYFFFLKNVRSSSHVVSPSPHTPGENRQAGDQRNAEADTRDPRTLTAVFRCDFYKTRRSQKLFAGELKELQEGKFHEQVYLHKSSMTLACKPAATRLALAKLLFLVLSKQREMGARVQASIARVTPHVVALPVPREW